MVKKVVSSVMGLVFIVGLCIYVYLLTNNKLSIGYNIGYKPDQPIPFSHKLHAGEYGIDCRYCHTATGVSRTSSIPSLNICMNCHLSVGTDKKWIQMLSEKYEKNEPIAWTKVHMLPDHVKFNHSRHIAAGKTCKTCHGPVEEMETVYQFKDLSMGWCVNCHRGVSDESLSDYEIKKLKESGHTQAPINCSTCHY